MKKIVLSSLFLFSLACGVVACTDGMPTDNWEEPVAPSEPAATTLQGSFESKFVRYSKGQQHEGQTVAAKIATLWKDTLWQNDRTHKQIVLWSGDKKYTGLTYHVSDLMSGANTISASNIQLRFPSYVKGDDRALDCRSYENRTTTLIADALSEDPVTTLTVQDPLKIWVTVNTPANAAPGIYTGTITVKSEGEEKVALNLELCVVNHKLPDVADWKFHLDLWQFPFQLATLCRTDGEDIILFSDEYFEMMKPFYQLLADAGQKAITTYIKDGAFNTGQTMVKWSKNASGEWEFDYADFDKFVEKMMEWGIEEQINCCSLVGWNTSIGYKDASGTDRTLELVVGSTEYNAIWTDFLTSFKAHLKEKGWFDKAVLYMDEIQEEQMKAVIALIKANDENWKIGLAGGNVSLEIENALYDYSTVLGYERQSTNAVSTFYTSCSQQFPNNYVTAETSPAEMPWMAWYARAKGFKGYLRWAYDYWTQSDPADIQDGSNAAGDFNMIYRSGNTSAAVPLSSIRLELLREGIQDYEKVRILDNVQLNAAIQSFLNASSGREAAKLVGTSEKLLKELSVE
ncbi:DUF4091 domain-containing protein [Bacteroides finegoldii]|uniref:DUF4091 domain-containing protein n=1 Tax=Bacteroides finegoldii TaxID=338188 RepID=UPI0018A05074|nr:DUF4091 domain-containing protein [Bacteroides finegoldii]